MKELNITADQLLNREKKLRRDIKLWRFKGKVKRYAGRLVSKINLRTVMIACILIVLTGVEIKLAYIQRGYFAVGGEYLIIPMAAFINVAYKSRRRK